MSRRYSFAVTIDADALKIPRPSELDAIRDALEHAARDYWGDVVDPYGRAWSNSRALLVSPVVPTSTPAGSLRETAASLLDLCATLLEMIDTDTLTEPEAAAALEHLETGDYSLRGALLAFLDSLEEVTQ